MEYIYTGYSDTSIKVTIISVKNEIITFEAQLLYSLHTVGSIKSLDGKTDSIDSIKYYYVNTSNNTVEYVEQNEYCSIILNIK